MTTVKLAAKLPDDNEVNGLDHWAGALRKEPLQQLVAICYLDVQKLITDYEKGQIQPVVQVVAIELLGRPDEIPAAVQEAFLAARDRRVNKAPLPFEDAPATPVVQHTDGVDVEASLVEAGRIVDAELVDDFAEGPACTCGHPFGDHDVDTRECCVADADGVACPCWEFVEADGGVAA